MKVTQDKGKFNPITITLKTREEAEALLNYAEEYYDRCEMGSDERLIAINISNRLNEMVI